MTLRINDTIPDLTVTTDKGEISLHDWVGDSWAVIFSHPKDFTPVCTTELGVMAGMIDQFEKRNTKVLGISVDPVSDHLKWKADIESVSGNAVDYPMIGDPEMKVAKAFDMLPADDTTTEGRTAATNATVRSVFVIGPDKKIKVTITYPMSTGRNFSELLRVIDSLQLTSAHQVATPADWSYGEDVIIVPAVSDDAAKEKFPDGWNAPRPYLRIVGQPA